MPEYAVELEPAAEDDLADLWLTAPDRAGVTRADAEADRLLRTDPLGAGRELSEGLYRLVVPPLAYFDAVDEAGRAVEVSSIGWVNEGGGS